MILKIAQFQCVSKFVCLLVFGSIKLETNEQAKGKLKICVPVGSNLLVEKIRLRLITMHILYLLINVLVGLDVDTFSG